MKRYRVFSFALDSRPSILAGDVATDEQRQQVRRGLVEQYGARDAEIKAQNFTDMGNAPVSIVSYHNRFFGQARDAFVIGSYYPALTAACTLGERILNHLMLDLRGSFTGTLEYKHVYKKRTFDDWEKAIRVLEAWGVLLPDVVASYRRLAKIRNNKAIHFDQDVEVNDRVLALEAIKTLSAIIGGQFASFGMQPWFIPNTPGESYISRQAEAQPFVRIFYLPACAHVGPYHRVVDIPWDPAVGHFTFQLEDNYPYEDREISDEEFARLRATRRSGAGAGKE